MQITVVQRAYLWIVRRKNDLCPFGATYLAVPLFSGLSGPRFYLPTKRLGLGVTTKRLPDAS